MYQIIKSIFHFSILLSIMQVCYAIQSDNNQPVHITADSATYNYKTGIDVFEGNVVVDQGTSHITAEKLVSKKNKNFQIEEVIASGTHIQAHYWTIVKEDEPTVNAYANVIKYYPLDSNVVLEDNVKVIQGQNSFQGQLILYNMRDETITVPASKKGRAVLVYNPE